MAGEIFNCELNQIFEKFFEAPELPDLIELIETKA